MIVGTETQTAEAHGSRSTTTWDWSAHTSLYASIYGTFGDKETLYVRALQRFIERLSDELDNIDDEAMLQGLGLRVRAGVERTSVELLPRQYAAPLLCEWPST